MPIPLYVTSDPDISEIIEYMKRTSDKKRQNIIGKTRKS
jgi:hypothetical protein